MVRDAETHAEEDKRRRELIGARNSADSLIYTAEKTLREAGDKVDAKLRTDVEDKIRDLRNTLDTEDVTEIQNRSAELSIALQQVGQAMYQETNAAAGDGEDVVEGEYQTE
jgi:molecular chaperone DnaK